MLEVGKAGIPYIYHDLSSTPESIELWKKDDALSDFFVGWTGRFDNVYNNHAINRTLDLYTILYSYSGQGYLSIDGDDYIIKPGMVFYIEKNVPHTYGNQEGGYWSGYWNHFDGESCPEMMALYFSNRYDVFSVGLAHNLPVYFEDIIDSMYLSAERSSIIHAANALRYAISSMAAIRALEGQKNRPDLLLRESVIFMQQNLGMPLTLKDMADRAHLSVSQFIRFFKKKTGYSPMQYYNTLRMKEACNRLIYRSATIQEIAASLGFENPYYFSTAFHRIIGCSPSSFVEQQSQRGKQIMI